MSISVCECTGRLYNEIYGYGSCPLLLRDFPSWLLLSSDSSTEMSPADNIAYLLNLRGADSTALLDEISDYFGGGDQEKEVLGMFT